MGDKNKIAVLFYLSDIILLTLLHYLLQIQKVGIYRYILMYTILALVFEKYGKRNALIWQKAKISIQLNVTFFVAIMIMSPLKELVPVVFIENLILCIGMMIFPLFVERLFKILFFERIANRVLIIGENETAIRYAHICTNNRFSLSKTIGFLSYDQVDTINDLFEVKESGHDYPVWQYSQLDEVIKEQQIDTVLVAVQNLSKNEFKNIITNLNNKVNSVKILPRSNDSINWDSRIEDFDGVLVVSSRQGDIHLLGLIIKRIIDIITGILGCIVLIPLTIIVKIMYLKEGDHDSIIFKQERIGRYGYPIYIYKYRSMMPNAEQELERLMETDESIKEEYLTNKKLKNDPRITKTGHWIRKSSIDEFPQFLNVLKGEMSFIGPRPYLYREKEDMNGYYDSIISAKPGITGMWQVHGRSDTTFMDRCRLDDYYTKNWTIWLDLTIVIKTIKSVFVKEGAR